MEQYLECFVEMKCLWYMMQCHRTTSCSWPWSAAWDLRALFCERILMSGFQRQRFKSWLTSPTRDAINQLSLKNFAWRTAASRPIRGVLLSKIWRSLFLNSFRRALNIKHFQVSHRKWPHVFSVQLHYAVQHELKFLFYVCLNSEHNTLHSLAL